MSLFVLDTSGDKDLLQKNDNFDKIKAFDGLQKAASSASSIATITSDDSEVKSKEENSNVLPEDISHIIEKIRSGGYDNENKQKDGQVEFMDSYFLNKNASKKIGQTDVEKEMEKSILRGLVNNKSYPCLSGKKLQELRRKEREKTNGSNWFNMPATQVTEEVENDLKILQIRSALDPKHFYKKNDLKVLPKYFQVGTVQHSPLDYYNERDTRQNKKRTIVDELLADAAFQKYNKRKYKDIVEKNQRTGYKKGKENEKVKKEKINYNFIEVEEKRTLYS